MNTNFEVNKDKTTTTWLTPPDIIKSLGEFDLDPCTPDYMPWQTAKNRFTEADDGLKQDWHGRVWLNPPYGPTMKFWLEKMAKHGNGTALTFNRSESKQFHDWVFPYATALLFKLGRIHFLNNEGKKVGNGPGCGSIFIAYGEVDAYRLAHSGIPGKFIKL